MRSALFWCHLALGVLTGVPILTMCVTGSLLALQPQILEWAERDQRIVGVPAGAPRLEPSVLLERATADAARADSVALTVAADPSAAAQVTVGRGQIRFVNPYTGAVLGHGATRTRATLQWLTEFHRWFASSAANRDVARAITGWSTAAFALLALTGLILWIPRKWSRTLVRRGLMPAWASTPAARHFNWHHVAGFWAAPILVTLAVTGVIIAFPWASRAVYMIAGSPVPESASANRAAPSQRPANRADERRAGAPAAADYRHVNAAWSTAERQLPTWSTITLRIQGRTNGPLSFTITDAAHWNRFARSQLVVSAADGAVMRWEPYSDTPRGQRWRGWARFAHTGELGGFAGQLVAGIACAAGALLVYTGLSLATRRLTRATRRAPAERERAA